MVKKSMLGLWVWTEEKKLTSFLACSFIITINLTPKERVFMAKHGDYIIDNGVTWKLIDNRINGTIAESPCFYERSNLFEVSNNSSAVTITTPDKLLINIHDHGYIATSSTININLTSVWDPNDTTYATMANRAGKDFYVYAVEQDDSDAPKWVISSSSTYPTNSDELHSRKVGGFHCLCKDVGTISKHPLTGYKTGWILPLSIWDLKHRPTSEPEGMVWVKPINKWVDIYLASWSGDADLGELVSVYKGTTADGDAQNGQRWHGEKFAEKFGLIGKHLPKRDEFMVFAKGSNEGTNITGSKDQVYTGGWTDTASRRMISNYGIEDCCGFLYQWTSDIFVVSGGNSWGNSGVYNSSVDSQVYGKIYGSLCRALVGGRWDDGSHCGSRYVNFYYVSSYAYTALGGRAASEPRRFE